MSTRSIWIPLHGDVFSHRKTIAAARDLTGGSIEKMVGHLARLWTWTLERNDDGDLSHLTDRMIADAAGWRGKPARFVGAITMAGFLDEDRHLHDWDDYVGSLIDRRQRDRERKRRERQEAKESGAFPSSAGGRPQDSPQDSPRDVRTHPTEPNRTKPKSTDTDVSSGQVSALIPSGSRGFLETPRLTERQQLARTREFIETPGWPLDLLQTQVVLRALAADATLPEGDLDFALGTYALKLEDSPLVARSPRGVEKAMRAWLTSHLRRDRLGHLMHQKRGSNDLLYDVLGTDQYSEMSDEKVEEAIALLERHSGEARVG